MTDTQNEEAEIRDTDIVFDCPHCGKNLVIDYRGAGLQIECSDCGEPVLVPIPDGMDISDLDIDEGEILKQLFATRRNYQKEVLKVQELQRQLLQIKESAAAMQTTLAALNATLDALIAVAGEGVTQDP